MRNGYGPLRAVMVILLLGAVGCAHLLQYSVEQEAVQAELDEQLGPLRDVRLEGPMGAFDFALRTADLTLGPEGAEDRIQVDILGRGGLDLPLGSETAALHLRLRGLPDFDPERGAVFVRGLELVDSRLESRWYEGSVDAFADPVLARVADLLEERPVYTIDRDSAAGAALGRVGAEVRVEPGKLMIVPGR